MTATQATPELAARYGRTPGKKRRDITLLIVFGAIVAIVVVAWVIWAGLDEANGSIDAEDAGHSIIDSRTVEISFQVSMPVGSTAECALQAQNVDHTVIGWKVVEVPASTHPTNTYRERVTTTEKPTAGLISSCWLT
jgi:hypothetical protein